MIDKSRFIEKEILYEIGQINGYSKTIQTILRDIPQPGPHRVL